MADVKINVVAEVGQAVNDLKQVDQALGGMEKAGKSTGISLTDLKSGLDLAIGGVKAVQAAVQSVIDPTVEYAAQVRTLGRTIGASAEESSKLIQAADDVGISAGTLQGALQAAIRKGVEPTIEGIGELAEKYNAIQDPIARTKFLMDNFGRSGAALAPLMEQGAEGIAAAGAEAEKLGLVLSGEGVQAARDYEIAIDNVEDSLMGLKIAAGQAALPIVSSLADGLTTQIQLTRTWNEAVKLGIVTEKDWGETHHAIAAGFLTEGQVLTRLNDEIAAYHKNLDAVDPAVQNMRQATANAAEVTSDYGNQLTAATSYLYELEPALTKTEVAALAAAKAEKEHSASLAVSAGIAGTLTEAHDTYRAVLEETTPEIEELTRQISKYEDQQGTSWTVTTEATATMAEYELAQIHAAEATQKLTEYTGDNREELLTLQVAAENANEKVGKLGEQMGISTTYTADYTTKLAENHAALEELKTKNEAAAEAMKKATAEFLFQQVAANLDAEAQLAVARELGLIDEPTYLAAKAAQFLTQAYKDNKLDADDLATATGGLRDIINSLQSRNIEITISTIYKEYHQGPAHEGDTGAGGEGGYNGGTGVPTIPNDNRDQRASGGPVSAGHPYLVGERGPEPFIPATNGYVMNNGDMQDMLAALQKIASSGGGNTYVVNGTYANQDGGTVAQELALMDRLYR